MTASLPTTVDSGGLSARLLALESRIQHLEAEAAVRRLVADYQWRNDAGSDSGTTPPWDRPEQPPADPAGLERYRSQEGMSWSGLGLSAMWPRDQNGAAVDDGTPRSRYMPRMLHFLTNEQIRVDGDRAEGKWYCWETATVRTTEGLTALFIAGRMTYSFRREAGEWRLSGAQFEEIFSTPAAAPDWLASTHFPYGPLASARRADASHSRLPDSDDGTPRTP
ncbi:nuclear transport factor 2 family protein [Dactylosporangium sp. CA-233914]|uniref:nuclear transport factor 2 family protein n=1 Tax=Dactylosporangium sp. CA-233914 TaxID=3239934 RepID=UPI003D8BCC10